jgi:hypothetical protein
MADGDLSKCEVCYQNPWLCDRCMKDAAGFFMKDVHCEDVEEDEKNNNDSDDDGDEKKNDEEGVDDADDDDEKKDNEEEEEGKISIELLIKLMRELRNTTLTDDEQTRIIRALR